MVFRLILNRYIFWALAFVSMGGSVPVAQESWQGVADRLVKSRTAILDEALLINPGVEADFIFEE
ncbi:hypothetical protein MLD52_21190 [Puniceicoccaceae bacterium K14]|nr:hypothetical protein [Puniceicoccaceae bacterium K14]